MTNPNGGYERFSPVSAWRSHRESPQILTERLSTDRKHKWWGVAIGTLCTAAAVYFNPVPAKVAAGLGAAAAFAYAKSRRDSETHYESLQEALGLKAPRQQTDQSALCPYKIEKPTPGLPAGPALTR